jgi:hypothetical protein
MSVYRFYWSNSDIAIPEGYELVEKLSHKKKRLEEQKSEVETWLKYNRKQVVDYEKKLEAIEKELKDL